MDNYHERVMKEFESQGLVFFTETFWSSSLQQSDLPKVEAFLKRNNFLGIDVSLVVPIEETAVRYRFVKYYDSTGQCVSQLTPNVVPAGSNCLKLTFGYPDSESRYQQRSQILTVVSSLRLVFGVPVARELIVTGSFGGGENATTASDDGFASYFDTQPINRYELPPVEDSEVVRLTEDAAFFLNKAFEQEFPGERFVLMWLAFEMVINNIVGNENNGQKRQAFFEGELQSEVANKEVFRLFKLRCELFKQGGALRNDIENDCRSLYLALQLATLREGEQRRAFLSGYEEYIYNRVL